MERDFYGKDSQGALTAPNLKRAVLDPTRSSIELEFDQQIVWDERLARDFYLDGEKGKVSGGSVSGRMLTLHLVEPTEATKITYLKEIDWKQDRLLKGTNGIAALTFCNVGMLVGSRGDSSDSR
jgi:hypothetical protein